MNKERLLRLADFLDDLPPERFNYASWASDDWFEGGCGTTACALGWACSMPEFQKLGATLVPDEFRGVMPRMADNENSGAVEVAERIFGLSISEYLRLFIPNNYADGRLGEDATAREVAAHIRKFVEEQNV